MNAERTPLAGSVRARSSQEEQFARLNGRGAAESRQSRDEREADNPSPVKI